MGHNYKDWLRTPVRVMASHRAWLENGDRAAVPADPFPPDWMERFTRDPLPEQVIWDLSTRTPSREADSFYYLRAPYETDRGMIRAGYSRDANRVWIETDGVEGNFSILLNEKMVDFAQQVTFSLNGKETVLRLVPDRRILERTVAERGDPDYAFEAEVSSAELAGGAGFD
jgi:hypothetical protein